MGVHTFPGCLSPPLPPRLPPSQAAPALHTWRHHVHSRDLAAKGNEPEILTRATDRHPRPALKLAPSASPQGLFLMEGEEENIQGMHS